MQMAAVATLVVGVTACQGDFLTGGELSNNPNVASSQTPAANIFIGTQVGLWNELGGNMSRITSILAQHLTGVTGQGYQSIQDYNLTSQTTNGFHQGLYIQGGLVDMRNLQGAARLAHDSVFLGVAQLQEAWMMGEGADLFGDLVYSQALAGIGNPQLDKQLAVYAHVEALLDTAITNMSTSGPTNVGPGAADQSSYQGNHTKWIRLAHTLKARFYMHQIHAPTVDTAAIPALVLAQVQLGLQSGDDYSAEFTGEVLQQNYWYQFNFPAARAGFYVPSLTLVDTLANRNDTTILKSYFNSGRTNLANARLQPTSPQTFATYVENQLLWAEAAYRASDAVTALTHLETARTAEGSDNPTYTSPGPAPSGLALLQAILMEKWISDLELGTEAWTDYRRTCTPNLTPTGSGNGGKVPGRFFYDLGEQQTDNNIPPAGQGVNGSLNQAQPALANSDGTGQPCLGQ
jgi:hypothetical protein